MESPAHRHHPAVNPMRYGFMDLSRNGVTVIGHGGDTFWFHSLMALFPESNKGLFVSFNTDKGGGTYMEVLEEFMKRYYPEKNALASPIKVDKKFLKRFAGAYRANRYAYHDITTISSLFGDLTIVVDSFRLKLTSGETVKYYIPVDSLTFREEHSSQVIAFKQDQKREIKELFLGTLPIVAFDKVSGLSSSTIHNSIFIGVALLTVIMLLYWPITSRARKGYEVVSSVLPLPPGAKIVGWLNYFFLAAFYAGLVIILADPKSIVYGVPLALKILLGLPFLIILLTLIMFLQLYRIWGNHRHAAWSRLFYLVITLMSVAALWQLYYWNFLGFHY
jgi:hypothetical protein